MKLCSAVVTKTEELCPSFLSQAREISVKFEQVFKVFAACHFVYDSADYLADGKIDKLGKSKKKKTFMVNMNTIIRSCLKSVPPFLVFLLQRKTSQIFLGSSGKNSQAWRSNQSSGHMLEEHVCPFLRQWYMDLGFYGERRIEEYTLNSIPSPSILTMWRKGHEITSNPCQSPHCHESGTSRESSQT